MNRTMNRSMTQALCAIAVLCSSISITPAALAAKAVLVQSADEPGRAPYQQTLQFEYHAPQCPALLATVTPYCVASFPAVPEGMRLVVTYVSADFAQTEDREGPRVKLGFNANRDSAVDLPSPQYVIPGRNEPAGYGRYLASSPVTYFVDAGALPTVFLMSTSISKVRGSARVVLIGYLVALP